MRTNNLWRVLCVSVLCWLTACSSSEEVEASWQLEAPNYFPEMVYPLDNNEVTEKGFELGRMLFFETRISSDGTVSCGTCHQPLKAFSDPVHTLSVGVEGRHGTRNAPGIFNMAFQNHFFWDGGVNHLDLVPVNAITNELEMDETVAGVVKKLNELPEYRSRFNEVFQKDSVDSQQLLHALSQFMMMLVSDQSPYDKYLRGEYELTAAESRGMLLFEKNCTECHSGTLFTDESFRNNGLDIHFSNDLGRARITEYEGDEGKFKVPSLRNVQLTNPYMHDGRFSTLEEVLDHYAGGVEPSKTLDASLLKEGEQPGIRLSDDEKSDIITFLKTLTDREFVSDSRFFDPN